MTLPTDSDRAAGRAPVRFVAFLALMTSVVALTIDAILPALDGIAADLDLREANDRQLAVTLVFAGLGVAQLVFGPLADAYGRKSAAAIGWAIYLVGSLMGALAETLEMLMIGRFLQGFGAAGPRIVAVAIVRDLYEGRAMARMLSVVMTVFMLVPMLAPLIGQGIEALAGWRAIFVLYLALASISLSWYVAAVPETLDPVDRQPLHLRPVLRAIARVITDRQSARCIFATVCVFTSFLTYLATAQQVFEEDYALGPLFPLTFTLLAIVFAIGSYANGRVVMRLGMWRLCRIGLTVLSVAGFAGAIASWAAGGLPDLWLSMALFSVIFMAVALLFANLNALAMEPHGDIAGTASSVVLSLSTLGSMAFGTVLAQSYDGSLMPMFAGFGLLGLLALWAVRSGGHQEKMA